MTNRAGVICAGNWIVDLVHTLDHWPTESHLVRIGAQTRGIGGGPANVIGALAKLGTDVPLWPMGAVGNDDYGRFVLAECRALGLPTSQLRPKPGTATAHTHVMSVPGQSRTFFYQGGANDVLCLDDFPKGTFSQTNARVFYLGYLTLLAELDRIDEDGKTDAARVLQRAQNAGLITCVDLVSAENANFPAIVAAAAPYIDYLILNETEAARAAGLPDDDPTPDALAEMGRALTALGICQAVVVHAADHVHWQGADGRSYQAATDALPPSDIASHLGAGDAFCAGLLFALHEGWTPPDALALGQAVAAASLRGITATSAIPPLTELRPTRESDAP